MDPLVVFKWFQKSSEKLPKWSNKFRTVPTLFKNKSKREPNTSKGVPKRTLKEAGLAFDDSPQIVGSVEKAVSAQS